MQNDPAFVAYLYVLAIAALAIFGLFRLTRLLKAKSPQPAAPSSETEPVAVFEAADPALIPVVTSLLNEAGIQFFTSAESTQDLIGGGRLGGSNLVTGPVQFFVRRQDLVVARETLSTFVAEGPLSPEEQ